MKSCRYESLAILTPGIVQLRCSFFVANSESKWNAEQTTIYVCIYIYIYMPKFFQRSEHRCRLVHRANLMSCVLKLQLRHLRPLSTVTSFRTGCFDHSSKAMRCSQKWTISFLPQSPSIDFAIWQDLKMLVLSENLTNNNWKAGDWGKQLLNIVLF